MSKTKTLQELTIIDDFLFGAVMSDSENCRLLLEMVLDMPISYVEVITEKQLRYHPEYKGVRLDVYAKDENNTHFNVEMQVKKTPIEKRSRYYHAQMDMDLLLKGTSYDELPDGYVIFICDYDPFKEGKYRYSIRSKCDEVPDLEINDGIHTIILNNKGKNPDEVPDELVRFLKYTNEKLEDSEIASEDAFIRRVQQTIYMIKSSREMEVRYMGFLDIVEDRVREETEKRVAEVVDKAVAEAVDKAVAEAVDKAVAEAVDKAVAETVDKDRAETNAVLVHSIIDILAIHGPVSHDLEEKLMSFHDLDLLKKLILVAAQVDTIDEFEKQLQTLSK